MTDWTEGSIASKALPDNQMGVIWPLTYGRARLVVGPAGSPFYDDGW